MKEVKIQNRDELLKDGLLTKEELETLEYAIRNEILTLWDFDSLMDNWGGSARFREFDGEVLYVKREKDEAQVVLVGCAKGTFWEGEKEFEDEMCVRYEISVDDNSYSIDDIYYEFSIEEEEEEDL